MDARTPIPEQFTRFAGRLSQAPAVQAIAAVGSVLTEDYRPGRSDINSVVVVDAVEQTVLDYLVELGSRFKEERIAAPMLMTPAYIAGSLDAFPIEFLNYQQIHATVFGAEFFNDLAIEPSHLRLQCERELRSKLLWLGQCYITTLGERRLFLRHLAGMATGYLPLLRAVAWLCGRDFPVSQAATMTAIAAATKVDSAPFAALAALKDDETADEAKLRTIFHACYRATDALVHHVENLDR